MILKYETCLLAKEKGYPQGETYDFWMADAKTITDKHYRSFLGLNDEEFEALLAAPTQDRIERWLRDEQSIYLKAHPINTGQLVLNWEFVIFFLKQPLEGTDGFHNKMSLHVEPYFWNSYEEATEAGIQEALRQIK